MFKRSCFYTPSWIKGIIKLFDLCPSWREKIITHDHFNFQFPSMNECEHTSHIFISIYSFHFFYFHRRNFYTVKISVYCLCHELQIYFSMFFIRSLFFWCLLCLLFLKKFTWSSLLIFSFRFWVLRWYLKYILKLRFIRFFFQFSSSTFMVLLFYI